MNIFRDYFSKPDVFVVYQIPTSLHENIKIISVHNSMLHAQSCCKEGQQIQGPVPLYNTQFHTSNPTADQSPSRSVTFIDRQPSPTSPPPSLIPNWLYKPFGTK